MSFRSLVQQNIFWKGGFIASGLIVSIVLARSLKPALTGDLYYNIAEMSLFIQVAGLSLESGIGYFVGGKKMNTGKVVMIALIWTILITLVALSAGLLLKGTFRHLDGYDIAFFISGNLLYTYFTALYSAQLSFRIPNIIGIVVNILICVAAMYYWKFSGKEGYGLSIISMFYFSFFIKGILVASTYLLGEKRMITGDSKPWTHLFKYSLVACFANTLAFLLYRIDYYFVEKFCTDEQLGNYIQVSKISQMFFMIPAMTASVVFPLASSNVSTALVEKIIRIFRITFYGTTAACIFLAISGYWLFPFLFGEEFNRMYVSFLLMSPGIICFSALAPITAYNAGKNRIDLNIKASIIAVVFIFIADYILVPVLNIEGAALVSSIAYILFMIYILHHFKVQQNFALPDVFKFKLTDYTSLVKLRS